MKKILVGLLALASISTFATEAKLVVTAYQNYMTGDDTDELYVTELTMKNVREASAYHYMFREDNEYIDTLCYKGDVNKVISIIETILIAETGDSWQELGRASVNRKTISYPFTYIDQGGEHEVEAIVPSCK